MNKVVENFKKKYQNIRLNYDSLLSSENNDKDRNECQELISKYENIAKELNELFNTEFDEENEKIKNDMREFKDELIKDIEHKKEVLKKIM
ncbi:hypothetical protein MCANUFG4_02181 [Mycoplasmopsis canis UFG4]|uniref:Uncharacterized protein n=2 Tax=Mycoplasmopsis canis TaxID=29555 RepID=I1A5T2_9BACT|nr:hypothetical protein [Mycoplasmopsis canis]AKF40966.1 hypothetical protein AAW50_00720 [Mycoplasmopsis canis]AMD81081.1 hypothetical protein AXW82_00695 [Mycoplasmopsis canis PG 14]EIE39857.1 hypothetical protein MCANPG14_02271 [Mycoplasmopsis canis PG 14]EIE40071.1 hypothetical protein MCANUF31_02211 [Mycoplasmopsis canis UF31]EIE40286.1 hypothetical protein MCANUF33_02221 [Mycoplasmopsis canis UF33]